MENVNTNLDHDLFFRICSKIAAPFLWKNLDSVVKSKGQNNYTTDLNMVVGDPTGQNSFE